MLRLYITVRPGPIKKKKRKKKHNGFTGIQKSLFSTWFFLLGLPFNHPERYCLLRHVLTVLSFSMRCIND